MPQPRARRYLALMHRLSKALVATMFALPFSDTAVVFAQNAPRDPTIGTRSSVWLGYFVAAVFAGILLLLTLFPSKRQHEDL